MDLIPVTELKQWVYCPRIVYYHQVMPGVAQPTYKMQEAVRAQDLIERLEMRRGLQRYGLDGAERICGVWLADHRLGLSGRIDLILRSAESAAIVDFKLTSGEPGQNHRIQLAGYAALIESQWNVPVTAAFLYRIPDNHIFHVDLDEPLRKSVREAISAIQDLRISQAFPEPTPVRGRCVECEYANFCGDIW